VIGKRSASMWLQGMRGDHAAAQRQRSSRRHDICFNDNRRPRSPIGRATGPIGIGTGRPSPPRRAAIRPVSPKLVTSTRLDRLPA
jgi:hypothetical protein